MMFSTTSFSQITFDELPTAFEPDPDLYAYAERNANKLSSNVMLHDMAVSDKSGKATSRTIFTNKSNSG